MGVFLRPTFIRNPVELQSMPSINVYSSTVPTYTPLSPRGSSFEPRTSSFS